MEIGKKLAENRGEAALHLALVLLVGIMLLAAFLQIQSVYAAVDRVKAKTNAAVLAVAASNGPEVYRGVRESDGTARRYDPEGWGHMVSTEAVLNALTTSLGGVPTAGGLTVGGTYTVTGLHTQFVNADGGNLNFTTTLVLEIPLSLGGGVLPPVRKELEVHTTYEPKF